MVVIYIIIFMLKNVKISKYCATVDGMLSKKVGSSNSIEIVKK